MYGVFVHCADFTEIQVLMGKDNVHKGIFSKKVISDFHNILKTEDTMPEGRKEIAGVLLVNDISYNETWKSMCYRILYLVSEILD